MQHKTDRDTQNQAQSVIKEAILELVENEGRLILCEVGKREEPLVSIEFSDMVKKAVDDDMMVIGQHMIHAAIQLIMHKQMKQWHAQVYDKEPAHYS